MMKRFTTYFVRGLVALLPLFLCIYFLLFFLSAVEELLHKVFFSFLPILPYVQGMGILLGIAIILLVGFSLDSQRLRRVMSAIEMPFQNVPIVKSIYSAMKDLTHFFSPTDKRANRVVLVKFPHFDLELVGFVTRENLKGLPSGMDRPDAVAVYLPMSYQLGGFTVFVPKEWTRELNMNVEAAMRSSLTAWMPGSTTNQEDAPR